MEDEHELCKFRNRTAKYPQLEDSLFLWYAQISQTNASLSKINQKMFSILMNWLFFLNYNLGIL